MGEEEIGDLDFDTYFNVTSNAQRQQQLMYNHHLQQQQALNAQRNRYPSQSYFPSQPQPSYEMMTWYVNPSSSQQDHSPVYSESRPEYMYAPTTTTATTSTDQFNSAHSQSHPSANEQNYMVNSGDIIYNLSDQTENLLFPTHVHPNETGLITPISPVDMIPPPVSVTTHLQPSSESNSPGSTASSPDNVTLSANSFPVTNSEQSNGDCHETRHWRKPKNTDSTTARNNAHSDIVEAAVAAVNSSRKPIISGKQFKKVAHNAIERRYRKNINERILDLKNVVPALYKKPTTRGEHKSSNEEFEDSSDDAAEKTEHEIVDGVEVAKKLNKATILHKATEYIHHLKHTNDLAERENRVLLQILAQVPGGAEVLAEFQIQKLGHQQAEQDRLIAQRKESLDHEKIEHQRMLRERAAQRAALAELVPKPERKPYPRRVKRTPIVPAPPKEKSSVAAISDSNKPILAMFLGVALVSPLSFNKNTTQHNRHQHTSHHSQQAKVHFIQNDILLDQHHHQHNQ
ncbi:hypothetical protein INT47_006540 [Mucor saturninus]|uniref:BHLH domain-containing protein n=1 Tax=Mucor saturninus TaxID=64648 RepID=A0A8H7QYD0_9FUNG|nr:hypothetical protein INT47_006540 [Mucor saturninus]